MDEYKFNWFMSAEGGFVTAHDEVHKHTRVCLGAYWTYRILTCLLNCLLNCLLDLLPIVLLIILPIELLIELPIGLIAY